MGQFTSSTFGNTTRKWLVGVGLLELVLGAGFLVWAFVEPVAGIGLAITGVILAITGGVLLVIGRRVGAGAAEAERIATTGIAGTATITALTQTGMTLNDQPQVAMDLLVQLPDRPAYAARRKEFVPLILLGRLTSGLPLPVRVDRADTRKVIVDWANVGPTVPAGTVAMAPLAAALPGGLQPAPGAAPAAPAAPVAPAGTVPASLLTSAGAQRSAADGGVGFAAIDQQPAPAAGGPAPALAVSSAGGTDETLSQVHLALAASGMPAAQPFRTAEQANYTIGQLRELLRVNGIAGQATIDKLADTGEVVGDERLFTMQVTLHVPGRPPQQLAPSAAMVPLAVAPRVALGITVPVKVAPDNPGLVMFEWERL